MMSIQSNDTIQVSFDMMQNQPLPKHSVSETFYSKQVWLYNLTFVINSENDQSKKNCFLYTQLETESGRGPNEIGSALIHFLNILENRYKTQMNLQTILNLYSDSCAGQNKNQYIMATLLNYINCKETIFKKITHIFPVRGIVICLLIGYLGESKKNQEKEKILYHRLNIMPFLIIFVMCQFIIKILKFIILKKLVSQQ